MSEENVRNLEVSSSEQENEGMNIVDIFFLCLNKWQ